MSEKTLMGCSLSQDLQQAPVFCPQLNRRENLQGLSHEPHLPRTSCLVWGQVSEGKRYLWLWQSLMVAWRHFWEWEWPCGGTW
jgi:hypothetical protein